MRSYVVLLLMGFALLTLALVVRSGYFFRGKNIGAPMNKYMREMIEEDQAKPVMDSADALYIDQHYLSSMSLADGLRYLDRKPGTGLPPQQGDLVTVAYTGRLLNGKEFDSSPSFSFRVGTGQVIKGWDEAFMTMRQGEKRTLIIPYWLAYGEKGHPPEIPPRATLVFDVQVLSIK